MSTTPPSPSDGDGHGPVEPAEARSTSEDDGHGPVEPAEAPTPGTGLAGTGAGTGAGTPNNGAGKAALICGGLAALFSVVFFPLGVLVLGLAAVVLGIMGIRRAGRGEATNKSQAVAGLVAGILGLVVFGARTAAFISEYSDELRQFNLCVQAAETDGERDECQRRLDEEIRR